MPASELPVPARLAARGAVALALALCLPGACTSAPAEVESRRRQRDEVEAAARNEIVLESLRAGVGAYSAELARAVEDLSSSEFDVSTAAERRLVAAGRESLPALAAAEGLTVSVLGSRVDPVAAVVREIHRRDTVTHLLEDLSYPSSEVRISAAEVLSERDEIQAIPSLVARLRDPDPRVASAFAMAVSRLSRRYFGPFEAETSEEREALFRRIESWFLFPTVEAPGVEPSASPPVDSIGVVRIS